MDLYKALVSLLFFAKIPGLLIIPLVLKISPVRNHRLFLNGERSQFIQTRDGIRILSWKLISLHHSQRKMFYVKDCSHILAQIER